MTATPLALARGKHQSTSKATGSRTSTNKVSSFVEYETAADLATAVEKLDNRDFKNATVRCISDVS